MDDSPFNAGSGRRVSLGKVIMRMVSAGINEAVAGQNKPKPSFGGASKIRRITTRFRLIVQHPLNFLFQGLKHDGLR